MRIFRSHLVIGCAICLQVCQNHDVRILSLSEREKRIAFFRDRSLDRRLLWSVVTSGGAVP